MESPALQIETGHLQEVDFNEYSLDQPGRKDFHNGDHGNSYLCTAFSIRGYVSRVREMDIKKCWPFKTDPKKGLLVDSSIAFLPTLEVPKSRYWECSKCIENIRNMIVSSKSNIDKYFQESQSNLFNASASSGIFIKSTVALNERKEHSSHEVESLSKNIFFNEDYSRRNDDVADMPDAMSGSHVVKPLSSSKKCVAVPDLNFLPAEVESEEQASCLENDISTKFLDEYGNCYLGPNNNFPHHELLSSSLTNTKNVANSMGFSRNAECLVQAETAELATVYIIDPKASCQEAIQMDPEKDSCQEAMQLDPEKDNCQEVMQLDPEKDSCQEAMQLDPEKDSVQYGVKSNHAISRKDSSAQLAASVTKTNGCLFQPHDVYLVNQNNEDKSIADAELGANAGIRLRSQITLNANNGDATEDPPKNIQSDNQHQEVQVNVNNHISNRKKGKGKPLKKRLLSEIIDVAPFPFKEKNDFTHPSKSKRKGPRKKCLEGGHDSKNTANVGYATRKNCPKGSNDSENTANAIETVTTKLKRKAHDADMQGLIVKKAKSKSCHSNLPACQNVTKEEGGRVQLQHDSSKSFKMSQHFTDSKEPEKQLCSEDTFQNEGEVPEDEDNILTGLARFMVANKSKQRSEASVVREVPKSQSDIGLREANGTEVRMNDLILSRYSKVNAENLTVGEDNGFLSSSSKVNVENLMVGEDNMFLSRNSKVNVENLEVREDNTNDTVEADRSDCLAQNRDINRIAPFVPVPVPCEIVACERDSKEVEKVSKTTPNVKGENSDQNVNANKTKGHKRSGVERNNLKKNVSKKSPKTDQDKLSIIQQTNAALNAALNDVVFKSPNFLKKLDDKPNARVSHVRNVVVDKESCSRCPNAKPFPENQPSNQDGVKGSKFREEENLSPKLVKQTSKEFFGVCANTHIVSSPPNKIDAEGSFSAYELQQPTSVYVAYCSSGTNSGVAKEWTSSVETECSLKSKNIDSAAVDQSMLHVNSNKHCQTARKEGEHYYSYSAGNDGQSLASSSGLQSVEHGTSSSNFGNLYKTNFEGTHTKASLVPSHQECQPPTVTSYSQGSAAGTQQPSSLQLFEYGKFELGSYIKERIKKHSMIQLSENKAKSLEPCSQGHTVATVSVSDVGCQAANVIGGCMSYSRPTNERQYQVDRSGLYGHSCASGSADASVAAHGNSSCADSDRNRVSSVKGSEKPVTIHVPRAQPDTDILDRPLNNDTSELNAPVTCPASSEKSLTIGNHTAKANVSADAPTSVALTVSANPQRGYLDNAVGLAIATPRNADYRNDASMSSNGESFFAEAIMSSIGASTSKFDTTNKFVNTTNIISVCPDKASSQFQLLTPEMQAYLVKSKLNFFSFTDDNNDPG